jgi:hypothetical protein
MGVNLLSLVEYAPYDAGTGQSGLSLTFRAVAYSETKRSLLCVFDLVPSDRTPQSAPPPGRPAAPRRKEFA